MKEVKFDSNLKTIGLATGGRLLDGLLSRKVKVKMLCNGRGLCATCHVYITANPEGLTPRTDREKLTLAVLTGAQENSRLACQANVIGDGVELQLPAGLYVESFSELEALVGQRTSAPILHPVTGETLVPADKIIMRSMIMRLKDIDMDIQKAVNA